jgi:hypothetical protein
MSLASLQSDAAASLPNAEGGAQLHSASMMAKVDMHGLANACAQFNGMGQAIHPPSSRAPALEGAPQLYEQHPAHTANFGVGQMSASAATQPGELVHVGQMVGGRPDDLLQVGQITGSRPGEFFPVVIANPVLASATTAGGAPSQVSYGAVPCMDGGMMCTNGLANETRPCTNGAPPRVHGGSHVDLRTSPEGARTPARQLSRPAPAVPDQRMHVPPPPWAAAAAAMVGAGGWTSLHVASSENHLESSPPRGEAPDRIGESQGELKQRQSRWQVTPEEQANLEAAYLASPFPVAEERASLAAKLQVSHRRIQVWFQNKRQKERKTSKPPPFVGLTPTSAWIAETPPADCAGIISMEY